MKLLCRFFVLTILTLTSLLSFAQQNTLTFGLNITHFNDWKKGQFLNFFNPEVGYSRQINEHYQVSALLNVFYGEALHVEGPPKGKVIYRLIFSNDYQLEYIKKGFFTAIGPTVRYRNEHKILYRYPEPNPFEIVTDPKKSHFDIGGVIRSGYNLRITKRSLLALKLTYRLYNKGVNPISFGVLYGLTWD